MTYPSRTLQNSIFEPLYSLEEELHLQPSSLPPSLSCTSPISAPAYKATTMRRAAATIFNNHTSEDSKSDDHIESIALGMHSPSSASSTLTTSAAAPSRSRSSSDVVDYDDGSVASKLLNSITKSISSPSLLACCKESIRETPYQKTLMLRRMKLQHCAEELGSESSDGSICDGNYYNNIFDGLCTMRSSQSTTELSEEHQKIEGDAISAPMISVRSSPNLRCPPSVAKHTSHMKERSFPPPLTHNLPRSNSSDSSTFSLRAYREDGRFVLKEVKVPCRKYFQSSRRDGRLTLQLLTTDEELESKDSEEDDKECRGLTEGDIADISRAATEVAPEKGSRASCDKIEVEAASRGELEVCKERESKKTDQLGMDSIDVKINVECLSTKSLLMESLSYGNCGSSKDDKADFICHASASTEIKASKKHTMGEDEDACVRMRFSNQHLVSSSWRHQSPIHPPGKSPNMKLGDDFAVTKCEVSLGLECPTGGETTFEIVSASLQASGYGIGSTASSSTMIFKDVSAKCLMENMSKLVPSFALDGRKWSSCEEKMQSREADSSHSEGVMERSMCKGIKSINIGVREIKNGSHKAYSGVSFDVKCERGFCCGTVIKGNHVDVATRGCLPMGSSLHFDVQIPSTTNHQAAFQGKEWLQTLHCKEILYRNHLAKGFMKLHCVA